MNQPNSWHIPADVRQQIASEPPHVSARSLSPKYGYSFSAIAYIRRQAGVICAHPKASRRILKPVEARA